MVAQGYHFSQNHVYRPQKLSPRDMEYSHTAIGQVHMISRLQGSKP